MHDLVAKDHLNPNRFGSDNRFDYGEWRVLPEDYGPVKPYLAARDEDEDELAQVIPYVEGQINRLCNLYEFADHEGVKEYLERNSFLYDLLLDARERIREYFDSETPVTLDILREPDARNSGRLFVLILTALRPKEAVARLDELDRDWWFDAPPEARGKLSIIVDYG